MNNYVILILSSTSEFMAGNVWGRSTEANWMVYTLSNVMVDIIIYTGMINDAIPKGHHTPGNFQAIHCLRWFCRQWIACKFSSNPQATRCIQNLYPDLKMVVFCLLLALFYWLRHQGKGGEIIKIESFGPENAYKINYWTLYCVKAGSLFKYIDQFTYFCHSQMAILICVQIIMTTWVV